jgi:hypothetical protein
MISQNGLTAPIASANDEVVERGSFCAGSDSQLAQPVPITGNYHQQYESSAALSFL